MYVHVYTAPRYKSCHSFCLRAINTIYTMNNIAFIGFFLVPQIAKPPVSNPCFYNNSTDLSGAIYRTTPCCYWLFACRGNFLIKRGVSAVVMLISSKTAPQWPSHSTTPKNPPAGILSQVILRHLSSRPTPLLLTPILARTFYFMCIAFGFLFLNFFQQKLIRPPDIELP